MELELVTLFALFGVALVAGFIDAIAGGGGLLTVPALLATGMPRRWCSAPTSCRAALAPSPPPGSMPARGCLSGP